MSDRKLLRSNVLLIIISCFTITSSILLECLHGDTFLGVPFIVWVWTHIALGVVWSIAIFYHLFLHWGNIRYWFKKIIRLNSKLTMCLAWLFFIILFTGIVAAVNIGMGIGHTPIGGLHGKLGLLAIVLIIFHLYKRWKWLRNRKSGNAYRPIVDNTKCVACEMCLKRCPAQVFEKQGNLIVACRTDYCLQCMKCVRHCPKQAISGDKI